jgi:hypothetical protein
VLLDLHPEATLPLTVYELRAPKAGCPPLSDLHLEPTEDGRGIRLRIRIPNGQPAAAYAGVIVDEGGTVRGTLTVRLGRHAPDAPNAEN